MGTVDCDLCVRHEDCDRAGIPKSMCFDFVPYPAEAVATVYSTPEGDKELEGVDETWDATMEQLDNMAEATIRFIDKNWACCEPASELPSPVDTKKILDSGSRREVATAVFDEMSDIDKSIKARFDYLFQKHINEVMKMISDKKNAKIDDLVEPLPGEDNWPEETILDEAARLTSQDRQATYDHPRPNHERIARLWNAYLDNRPDTTAALTPDDCMFMQILVKIARDQFAKKRDSIVDIAGYARCIEKNRAIAGIEGYAK